MKKFLKAAMVVALVIASNVSFSQNLLNKTISIDVNRQRLDNVLEIISNKGDFYFSYSSSIIKKDSLVTMSATKTVREILNIILREGYEYRESGNYLIIRRAPVKLTLVTNRAVAEDKYYMVSGYVLDDETGYMIPNASIYEKTLLASALTNGDGYFKLRIKNKVKTAALTVSKEFYEDTTVTIDPGYNQQISITIVPISSEDRITIIRPEDYFLPDSLRITVQTNATTATTYTYVKVDSATVEKTGFGNFLISSRQKIQSLNLRKFFTERPFQISITPGLSTHGSMSSQVINNFSLNVFGGYSGGVKGVELGGLFNIDKKNVQFFQAAGLFNIVGGSVKGVQLSGITNTVLDSVKGFQAAGVNNHVTGKFSGFQLAGVYNHAADSVKGLQVAGVGNFARRKVTGTQIAGVANFSNKEITGSQIAGVINYAKKIRGVQIGVLNIADSSDGYHIGLVNIVLHGYHKLSFSTNEFINTNASLKTGTRKMYSILQAGINWGKNDEKAYSFGYGLGSELRLGKTFSINPELSSQYLYLGSWDHLNLLNKFSLNLNLHLGKYVSIFGGPAFNVYYSQQPAGIAGYKSPVPPSGYNSFSFSDRVKGWIGWNAGIHFF